MEHPSPQAVTTLQSELLQAQRAAADARAEAAELKARLDAVTAARAAAAAAESRVQGEAEVTVKKLRLAEGRQAIMQTEVDGLKRLVDILQADAAVSGDGGGVVEVAAAARAESLEQQLAAARAALTAAEELAAAAAEAEAKARERAGAAEESVKALEREAGDLGREVGRLQSAVAAGDFNPATTRVLHLAVNPTSERRRLDDEAAITRLRAENAALKRQLQSARQKLAAAAAEAAASAAAQATTTAEDGDGEGGDGGGGVAQDAGAGTSGPAAAAAAAAAAGGEAGAAVLVPSTRALVPGCHPLVCAASQ